MPVVKAQEKNWRRDRNSFLCREGKVTKSLRFQHLICAIPRVHVSHRTLSHLPGTCRVPPVPPHLCLLHLHRLRLDILTGTSPTCAFFSDFFSCSITSCTFLTCILLSDISSTLSPPAHPPRSLLNHLHWHHPHLQGPLLHLFHLPVLTPHVALLYQRWGLAPSII